MKRLFEVKGFFFDNKPAARQHRNTLASEGIVAYVSKGPDHMGNHGIRVRNTRHRGPQSNFLPKEV